MAEDSIEQFTGDRAAAVQLRRSLAILSERFAGQPLGRQIDAVLSGRTNFRELADDPEFASMANEGMREYAEQWATLSPEEREDLIRQGEAAEAAINEELDGSQPSDS